MCTTANENEWNIFASASKPRQLLIVLKEVAQISAVHWGKAKRKKIKNKNLATNSTFKFQQKHADV